jgi:hypothetical protein
LRPTGKCPLCLDQKVLVLSHLISQAVYDYCRTDGVSPVRIGDGVIMHTDRQLKGYLLCTGCEDVLNKGGESWVTPRLARIDKAFPLHDLVMKAHAGFRDQNGGIYYAATNPDFKVEKLTHFALGIFWKAAVHSWSGSKTEPMIELGTYAETIRTWLRGETGFPKDVSLTVTLPSKHSLLDQEFAVGSAGTSPPLSPCDPIGALFSPWRSCSGRRAFPPLTQERKRSIYR